MNIKLPAGIFKMSAFSGQTTKNLIVAGGRNPGEKWLKAVAPEYQVWAADHGADYCQQAGIKVSYLYGDKDSVNPANWEALAARQPVIKTFPVAKNDTDLGLVLKDVLPRSLIVATGIWGGRADHLLANVFSLMGMKKKQGHTVLMADSDEIMLLLTQGERASFTVNEQMPHAVSLLPLEENNKVSIDGVKWPLSKSELLLTHPYAISNVMQNKTITVSCTKGSIGFYLNFKDGT
ncbi:MAG: thiamine diphosphokinase [Acidaminococcaceae bacterium]|nr:thiamine diphosphokinase [Acidaminococcaceae bacterium]